ncbi:MAG TPA: M42 family peptidase, partial [Anaerolineae bacterium]|nr:M42 family peptidase [Anaerolineae bacterium]
MKSLIEKLVGAFGPTGQEGKVAALIRDEVADCVDDIRRDALGNLIAVKHGQRGGRKVMLAAHMDEIGLVVSHIDEKGFCRVRPVGHVLTATLIGSRVRFANGVVGVFGVEDENRSLWKLESKLPDWDKWFLDIGANSREDIPVKVGDIAAFVPSFHDLGQRLVAQSMDDRVGCAVLIEVARRVKAPANDIFFVFTVQEEIGTKGAITATYDIRPDVGIAVDITLAADTPKAPPVALALGKGAAIKVMDSGMITHYGLRQALVTMAEEEQIPYQLEVLPGGTTDAYAIQLSREGIPTAAVSIPSRYAHSKTEMVDMRDVEASVALLTAF